MKKPDFRLPVTVSLHHHVLLPWAELRRTLAVAPQVITLDFHTDTLSALSRGITAEPGSWQNDDILRETVMQLHHDEHIDWA